MKSLIKQLHLLRNSLEPFVGIDDDLSYHLRCLAEAFGQHFVDQAILDCLFG